MTKSLGSVSWQDLLSTLREEAMVVAPDHTALYVNPPLLDRLGRTASQATGKPCHLLLRGSRVPCHLSGEVCPLKLVLETGRPASAVKHQARARDSSCQFDIEALPLKDAEGKLVSVLYLLRELGVAERYQRIFNAMELGVAVGTRDGRIVDVNSALCRMLGYTKTELVDLDVSGFIPGDLASVFKDSAERNSLYLDLDLPRKDGSLLPCGLTARLLPLGPVTLYVAFVWDITKRKEWEETVTRQARALAQSGAQYRALFESAGDALVVVEDNTTIAMVNRRFQEMTGYRRDEVEGKKSLLSFVVEKDRQRAQEIHKKRQEKAEGLSPSVLLWMSGKEGKKWLAEVTGALVPGTRRSLVSLRDVTEAHRLREESLSRNREMEALQAVGALVSRSTDIDQMLQRVLEKVLQITGLSRGCMYLLDEEQQQLFVRAHSGASETAIEGLDGLRIGEGFGGRVAETGEPLFIPDMSKDPRLARSIVLDEGFRSLASIPLVAGGKVMGIMSLDGRQVRDFPPEIRRLLVSTGNEIGVAVERALLLQKAQDRAREMESLVTVTREMASSLDVHKVLDRSLAVMCQQVGASQGFICLLDDSKEELTLQSFWGERGSAPGKTWRVGEGVAGWVARHQQPFVSDDIATDPRINGSIIPALSHPSAAAVPLVAKDRLLGVVVLGSREKGAFTGAHLRMLSTYAMEASMALENALLHEEVKKQASTDELTQVASRRYFYQRFEEEMKRAQRYSHPLSLLFLDVDNLKTVNDRYGHLQGDELLRHCASLLTKVLRSTDLAARYGGDEFVILLPETSREEAASVAERLIREASPCPLLSGGTLPWQLSIGVAWAPVDGSYDVDLLRLADEAVYRAKQRGAGWDFARVAGKQSSLPLDEDTQTS